MDLCIMFTHIFFKPFGIRFDIHDVMLVHFSYLTDGPGSPIGCSLDSISVFTHNPGVWVVDIVCM